MKKLLKNITYLSLISMMIYAGMMWLLCKIDLMETRGIYYVASYVPRKGGQELHAFRDYKADSTYQMLVLGSSHAYRGYDPRIFEAHGITSFNFGTSSQNPLISNHLLDHYINIHEGQVVLIDVYAGMFEGAGMESLLRMVIHEPQSSSALDLVRKSGDFRAWNTWCKRMYTINEPDEYWSGGYMGSGYTEIPDTLKVIEKLPGEYEPNEEFYDEIEELVQRIHDAKASVVFVSHPMPPLDGYQQRHQEFLKDLIPIVEEYEIPYLDHTFDEGYALWNFADENHLGQSGVELFNPILIAELRALGTFD